MQMKSVEEFLKQYKNIEKTNTYEIENNNSPIEEFDKAKTKILKYILYKKRSEAEVRRKFSSFIEENLLEDVIESLKQNNYIIIMHSRYQVKQYKKTVKNLRFLVSVCQIKI